VQKSPNNDQQADFVKMWMEERAIILKRKEYFKNMQKYQARNFTA